MRSTGAVQSSRWLSLRIPGGAESEILANRLRSRITARTSLSGHTQRHHVRRRRTFPSALVAVGPAKRIEGEAVLLSASRAVHTSGSAASEEPPSQGTKEPPSPTAPFLGPPPLHLDSMVYVGREPVPSLPPCSSSRATEDAAYSIRDALFGLTDFETSVDTYPAPRERVKGGMALLPAPVKDALFVESGWLDDLERAEAEATAGADEQTGAHHSVSVGSVREEELFADVVGRAKAMRFLLTRCLAAPWLWEDAVQEVLDLAVTFICLRCRESEWLEEGRHEKWERARLLMERNRLTMSDHMSFPPHRGRRPDVSSSSSTSSSGIAGESSGVAVLYGPALFAKLEALVRPEAAVESSAERFTGPTGTWDAFIVNRRQDAGLLATPQQAPFSFGETRASLSTDDVDWRVAAPSEDIEANQLRTIESQAEQVKRAAQLMMVWEELSEAEKNASLFGTDATVVGTSREAEKGIYVFEMDDEVIFSDVDAASAEAAATGDHAGRGSTAAAAGVPDDDFDDADADADATAMGLVSPPPSAASTAEEELARVQLYDVDLFMLGIVEPMTARQREILRHSEDEEQAQRAELASAGACPIELDDDAATVGGDANVPVRASRRQQRRRPARSVYALGGRVRSPTSGCVEDVQLSKLWEAFLAEDAAAVVDMTFAAQQRWETGVASEVRRELATQTAFLLWFFSLDEVRAVTPPKDTYERLWALRRQLVRVLLPHVLPGLGCHPADIPGLETALLPKLTPLSPPPFATLPPVVRVSYTCFGAAHLSSLLPPIPLRGGDGEVQPRPTSSESPITTPDALFSALLEKARSPESADQKEKPSFNTLVDEAAAFAVSFPFPSSPVEEAEVAGRTAQRTTEDLAGDAEATARDDADDDSEAVAGRRHSTQVTAVPGELMPFGSYLRNAEEARRPGAVDMLTDFSERAARVVAGQFLTEPLSLGRVSRRAGGTVSAAALRAVLEPQVRERMARTVEDLTEDLVHRLVAVHPLVCPSDRKKFGKFNEDDPASLDVSVGGESAGGGTTARAATPSTTIPTDTAAEASVDESLPEEEEEWEEEERGAAATGAAHVADDDSYTDDVSQIMAQMSLAEKAKAPRQQRSPTTKAKGKRGRKKKTVSVPEKEGEQLSTEDLSRETATALGVDTSEGRKKGRRGRPPRAEVVKTEKKAAAKQVVRKTATKQSTRHSGADEVSPGLSDVAQQLRLVTEILASFTSQAAQQTVASAPATDLPKRKRGRPPKQKNA